MLFHSRKENLARLNHLKDDDYELCVICGEITNIKKNEPVDRRTDYFPGFGQLCHERAIKNIAAEKTAMRNNFVYKIPVYRKGRKKKCSGGL